MTRETDNNAAVGAIELVEEPSRLRRIAEACGRFAALGALSAVAGATSLFIGNTDGSLGPHDADVRLTLDGSATFDLGPIGSIILPMETSPGIGVNIEVGEVPADASIDDYARSLATIEDDIESIKDALVREALQNTVLAGGAFYAMYRFIGKQRMSEHLEHMQNKWVAAGIAGLIAINLSGGIFVGLGDTSSAKEQGELADPIFAGTALENARLTGLLPQIVNDFGRDVIDMWRENEAFYDEVLDNLRLAFEDQRSLTQREGYPIMLFYTDNHCNVGMARVIGETARLSGAELVADGGDTTMGGTSYEEFCVQVLGHELPDIPRVVAGGNHDSPETERQLESHDFTVLNGDVVEIAGLRILGDDDVMRSRFGSPITQEGDMTMEQMSQHLAEIACNNGGVDVLLVHSPAAATDTINEECATTVLSGHRHQESLEQIPMNNGYFMFNLGGDNSSGATRERPSLGPVDEESPARIYLLKLDAEHGNVIGYQTVTVYADASVELSDIEILPVRVP